MKKEKPEFEHMFRNLPPGYECFGYRHCYELTYTSSQESHKYDSLFKKIWLRF